jgi:hypothetical protein
LAREALDMKKLLLACCTLLVTASAACMTEVRQGLEAGTDDGDSSLCTAGALGQAINSTGPVPKGCVKIEGSDIGKAPQLLSFSGMNLTIDSWRAKDDGGDFVGFSFTASGNVAYAVKAGTETFASSGTTWVHPKGTGGPAAKGISNITFCPNGGDGGSGVPEGPGNGGPCTPGGGGGSTDGGSLPEGGAGTGSPCSSGSQCASQTCTEGKCAPGGQGAPCRQDADCSEGNICTNGTCSGQIN